VSKLSIDLITLTEGDPHDIGEAVHDVTNEALQDFMQDHQTMLGALRAQLQELHVHPPPVGTLSTNLAIRSSVAEQMLCARMANTIVLLEGVLVTSNEADRFSVSMMKGFSVNLAAISRETLYLLQDGITTELHARKSRALQVLSKKKINLEQLHLQRDELVSQNQQLV